MLRPLIELQYIYMAQLFNQISLVFTQSLNKDSGHVNRGIRQIKEETGQIYLFTLFVPDRAHKTNWFTSRPKGLKSSDLL